MNGYLWTRLSRQMQYLSVQRGLDMVGRSQTSKAKGQHHNTSLLPPSGHLKRCHGLGWSVTQYLIFIQLARKATVTQENQVKTSAEGEKNRNSLAQESCSRGANPRLTERGTSLEVWWYLNQDHPLEAETMHCSSCVIKHGIMRVTG